MLLLLVTCDPVQGVQSVRYRRWVCIDGQIAPSAPAGSDACDIGMMRLSCDDRHTVCRRSRDGWGRQSVEDDSWPSGHSRSIACVASRSVVAASSSSRRARSMSFVVRDRAPSRRSSASAPFRSHRSGATMRRRARSRSKTRILRHRTTGRSTACAIVRSRCSRAVRNAPGVAYFIAALGRASHQ